jgi:hypothetical protein
MAPSDLDGYISSLGLADKGKFASVLDQVGIANLDDLERLDDGDRAELIDAMKAAAACLGDRSKAKKLVTAGHIKEWRATGKVAQAAATTAAAPTAASKVGLSSPKLAPVGRGAAPPSSEVRYGGVQLRKAPQSAPSEPADHNPPKADWRDRRPVSWMPDSERVGVDVTDTDALNRARALETLAECEPELPPAKGQIKLPASGVSTATRAELEAERNAREAAAAQRANRKDPIQLPTEVLTDERRAEIAAERRAREVSAAAPTATPKAAIVIPTEEVSAERRRELEAERTTREAKQSTSTSVGSGRSGGGGGTGGGDGGPTGAASAASVSTRGIGVTSASSTSNAGTTSGTSGTSTQQKSPAAKLADEDLRKARAAAAAFLSDEDAVGSSATRSGGSSGADGVSATHATGESGSGTTARAAVGPTAPAAVASPEPVFDVQAQRQRSKNAYAEALRKASAAREISEKNTGKEYFCKKEGGGSFAVQVDEDSEPIEDPRLFTGQGKFEYPDGGW